MVPQTDVTDQPDTAVRSHILTQVYPCPQGGVIDQPAVGPGAVPYVPLYTGPSDEDLTHFPREIAGMRQWSLWRLMPDPDRPGKWKKPPFDAYHLGPLAGGRTNERHLLASLEHCVTVLPLARARWRTDPAGFYGAGIGFHLFKDQGIFFLDLDHARDPATGEIEPWAQAILNALSTYSEVSQSQSGVHALGYGVLPDLGQKRGNLELYDHARYCALTGWRLPDSPSTLEQRQAEILTLHTRIFTPQSRLTPSTPMPTPGSPTLPPRLDDATLLARTCQAENGTKFQRLWDGDRSGYGTSSEADAAFCTLLTFWTRDPEQIDRLFRASGLMRPKWDQRRGQQTYGQRTIHAALAFQQVTWEPNRDQKPDNAAPENFASFPTLQPPSPCPPLNPPCEQNRKTCVMSCRTEPLTPTQVQDLYSQWPTVQQCKAPLGIPAEVHPGERFRCVLPHHDHEAKVLPPSEKYPTFTYWCEGSERALSLPHMYFIVRRQRDPGTLGKPSFNFYASKLLLDAGVVPCPTVRMPALPVDVPSAAQRVYAIVRELFTIRAVTAMQPESPLAWKFLADLGGITEHLVKQGLKWLIHHAYVVKVGLVKGMAVFVAGVKRLRRKRAVVPFTASATQEDIVAEVEKTQEALQAEAAPLRRRGQHEAEAAAYPQSICPQCGHADYWLHGVCHYCVALAGKARIEERRRLYGTGPPILELAPAGVAYVE